MCMMCSDLHKGNDKSLVTKIKYDAGAGEDGSFGKCFTYKVKNLSRIPSTHFKI